MSKDQMQDVFPIVFDFKKGEAPTAEKLTGLVKQLDIGLSKATQAIGDPWDQQLTDLSLENLGQSNLARIIGPTDYLSPPAGSWNESSTFYIVLPSGQNQWNLGFPLVKIASTIKEDSAIDALTPMVWGTDITSGSFDVLTTRETDLSEVVADGDFHVDFYTGTITSFQPATDDITLTLTGLASCGAGVPWATHNVIPTWEETTVLCAVAGSGTSYTLTLPLIKKSTRANVAGGIFDSLRGGVKKYNSYDAVISPNVIGKDSDYRLPQALIDNYGTGDTIPEGYVLLWDNTTGRVIPSVQFKYLDENSLTLITPTDWLSASTDRYRILIPGSSVAEAVNYLMSTTRDNRHVGLVDGALTRKTLFYSAPISHDTLTDLYSSTTDDTRLKYTTSNYPTNCHPQYLHRYGFMPFDADGNHANAMMGDIVFTNWSTYNYAVDSGIGTGIAPADMGNIYGIRFGGQRDAPDNYASIDWVGGQAVAWTSGAANKIGFGLDAVGCKSSSTDQDSGTLVYTPRYDGPLYLRGRSTSGIILDAVLEYTGGALGFDLSRNNELNYIKLFPVLRTSGISSSEVANLPAEIDQDVFATKLEITPNLDNRLCAEQLREFRFRGGPYLSTASNDGIGSTSTEFNKYFTSPGVVGADFLNLYSNAIFFSDTGDGKRTSLGDRGKDWFDSNEGVSSELAPSGLYYAPGTDATNPRLVFSAYDSVVLGTKQPFSVGYRHGFHYDGIGDISLVSGEEDIYISTAPFYSGPKGSYFAAAHGGSGSAVMGSEEGHVSIDTYATGKHISINAAGDGSKVNIDGSGVAITTDSTTYSAIDLETGLGSITIQTLSGTQGIITLTVNSSTGKIVLPHLAGGGTLNLSVNNNGEIIAA